ncbi:hypothetical protein CEXT_468321 [Caerostris extrusa]|uniref:Reverse transcriptase n=1 Tax=Caerostris extrusa TaxID=172846 RepID=A0AAV4P427_CAEEX|nr:hypothetical protein CEXT_468321 [Caerostris extrusa]
MTALLLSQIRQNTVEIQDSKNGLSAHQALDLQLTYRGTQIATCNSFKYLGVTFDRKLTWKPHTEDITNRAMRRLSALKLLDGTRWSCTGLTLLQTYHAFIRPF